MGYSGLEGGYSGLRGGYSGLGGGYSGMRGGYFSFLDWDTLVSEGDKVVR